MKEMNEVIKEIESLSLEKGMFDSFDQLKNPEKCVINCLHVLRQFSFMRKDILEAAKEVKLNTYVSSLISNTTYFLLSLRNRNGKLSDEEKNMYLNEEIRNGLELWNDDDLLFSESLPIFDKKTFFMVVVESGTLIGEDITFPAMLASLIYYMGNDMSNIILQTLVMLLDEEKYSLAKEVKQSLCVFATSNVTKNIKNFESIEEYVNAEIKKFVSISEYLDDLDLMSA